MKYAIGIDLGGTKISAGVVNSEGKVLYSAEKVATEEHLGKEKVLENIKNIVKDITSNFKDKLEGVGMGMPGFVDAKGVLLTGGPYLKSVVGVNIKTFLEESTGLPAFVTNDANCFAMAEARYGAGKGSINMAGVIWGTGVGAGIIVDGKLLEGCHGGAGEFAHFNISDSLEEHFDELRVSANCAGHDVVRMYKEKGGKIADPNVKLIYESDEPAAKEVINRAINFFGIALSSLVTTVNPELIVLGGGLSNLPDEVYDRLYEQVRKRVYIDYMTDNLKIVRYKLSADSGMIGAASLVFDRIG